MLKVSMHDAAAVHANALVLDGHADTPQRFVDESWDFTGELDGGMLNLDAARRGNLAGEFFAIWPEPEAWRGRYAERTLQLIAGVLEQCRRHAAQMQLCVSPEDILAARASGRFAALMGIEGGHAIEADLSLLAEYYRLGVRYMTLTWSNTNEWADSSGDVDDPSVPHHGGLTDFGRTVVREMNRLGMMVDVSHVSDATFWDVLRTTKAPVIASHSSARALTDVSRNLTDEMLRAVATSDGIVMVNFYPSFIDQNWHDAWQATHGERKPLYARAGALWSERGLPEPYSATLTADRQFYEQTLRTTLPRAPFESLIDHFDHVIRVAGIDHVGLGSDFDGFAILPAELESAADLPKITAALMERGYTEEQMRKLLGGNLLRVFGEVIAVGKRLRER